MKQPPPAFPGMKSEAPGPPDALGDEAGGSQLDRIEALLEKIAEAMGIEAGDAEGGGGPVPGPDGE